MYRIIAKQHKEASTPFGGFQQISIKNNYVLYNLGEFENEKDAHHALGAFLIRFFDAQFSNTTSVFTINGERVHHIKNTEFIYNGILIWIQQNPIDMNKINEWEEIETPDGLSYKLFIRQDEDNNVDIKIDDKYLMCIDSIPFYQMSLIDRKVFWLDPCALDGCEHTSDWKIIEDADDAEEIVRFQDGTEAYYSECYI